jgi:hypothetical protein
MKINELVGIKKHPAYQAAQEFGTAKLDPDETGYTAAQADNLTNQLKSYGWTLAGYGYSSLVFKNPKFNYVLKVFESSNKDWINFANYAMRHQDNPFVPKFMGKIRRISPSAYAVRMELLEPIKDWSFYNQYVAPEIQQSKRNNNVNWNDVFWHKNEAFLQQKYPQLFQVVDFLNNLPTHRGDLDLHDDNFMRRGNTLVITDPV